MRLSFAFALACGLTLSSVIACSDGPTVADFQKAAHHEKAAFMAVHGTSEKDVWVVGADDGRGPVALHFDGESWQQEATGIVGDLWWVQALPDGTTFFAGSDANIYRRSAAGEYERLPTPGLGKYIVFGLWAASANDLYAVGSIAGRNGFIWHYDGTGFEELAIPDELTRPDHDVPPLFKVDGTPEGDVWIVGGNGAVLRGNATTGFHALDSGTPGRLFTIHLGGGKALIVGGNNGGAVVLEADLADADETLVDVTPQGAPLLQGCWVKEDGRAWAVGRDGALYHGELDDLQKYPTGLDYEVESLHAVWVAPEGSVWAVGGTVISGALDAGLAIQGGEDVPFYEAPLPSEAELNACPTGAIDLAPHGSVARRWNEQLLNAIRRDLPRPTVHARNLLHTSIAMWDAWAAFEPSAKGVLFTEKRDVSGLSASELESARDEAISFAAYRVMTSRYEQAIGAKVTESCLGDFMDLLGYDKALTSSSGESAAALGNRIAAMVLDTYAADGSNQENNYADPDKWSPDQPKLIVDDPGVFTKDPTQWQQLLLGEAVTQNGISEGAGVRAYVGAHWGQVTPWALQRSAAGQPYFQESMAPTLLDDDLVAAAVDVLAHTAQLDVEDGELMDISPGAFGNNTLGHNDGSGHPVNPNTGKPYAPNLVKRGDFTRVMAEFWADGPTSETPPGHWNTLANQLADHPQHKALLFGAGDELDPLSWDVHVYLALNGALHDAAIAAWEQKRVYTSARPITLIRYLAGLGQRSDPQGPSYNPDGIPLVDDLIEVITEESSAAGERHEHLRRYLGEVAVFSWRGEPGDRSSEIGGFDWIRAADWIPYQRRTFVTPAFPGYVSGHSTFSRAGAEVLSEITGSEYFPGGLGSYEVSDAYLVFESGPTEPLTLQWATYYDAADQAGRSRLWGGIHIRNDDFDGRRIGSQVGQLAMDKARGYFE